MFLFIYIQFGGINPEYWGGKMKKLTVEECEEISISAVVWQQKYHILNIRPDITVKEFYCIIEKRLNNLERYTLMHNSPLRFTYTTTAPHFGGVRYWFLCPDCKRRVGKLYKPMDSYWFACRYCYNLTYKSCQTHNQRVDSVLKHLNRLERTQGKQAIDNMIAVMKSTRRGRRLFWKLHDKVMYKPFPPPFFARRDKEEETYNKYIAPLFES